MRRGRRDADELRVGDALDFFRVEAINPPHLLRLRAEMKVPGNAWLEWAISAGPDGSAIVRQLATFHPRGVAGRVYWWVLLPIHKIIWKRLAERLAALAELEELQEGRRDGHRRSGRRGAWSYAVELEV